ncbi:MAG TPA: Gfo/Idh/MocA family oxidoreductase [Vicinamibacteria bacterium]|nr:Gfo/Idh/MocA family oxidoreductase [Vicinamibacteria bacterium]
MANIAMLGTGLIGLFYTMSLRAKRSRDRVVVVHGRDPEKTRAFAGKHAIPRSTTRLEEAVSASDVDVVVVGLPNHLHLEAVAAACRAGKGVLCTKPLARTAAEAKQMLEAVERAGVFHGYLEDLVYTPKTRKALASVRKGAIGRVLWTRSREAHPGPHSDWFWTKEMSGGGALVDMGCHCIEIGRSFVGKDVRPAEAFCWGATQVHPIEAEDSVVGLVRYASGAVAQFESAWTFRGGMDLRDEVSGSDGTIWLNHWLRTGFEMFSAPGSGGYVAEKAETESGWLFPVGDETSALGYDDMFADMLDAFEEKRAPVETFYDGYVVNAIMDACYRSIESKRWEPVALDDWRGKADAAAAGAPVDYDAQHWLIKSERMPDGRRKLILKDKETGAVSQRVE